MWNRVVFIVIASLWLSGCPGGNGEGLDQNGRPIGETPVDDTPPAAASFAQIQNEIFTPFCVVCHAGAAAPVGLKLDNANSFASLVSVASVEVPGLLRVAPGDPDNSYLIQKLEGTANVGARMPLGSAPVPDNLIAAARQWITDGALPLPPDSGEPPIPVVAATVPLTDSVVTNSPDSVVAVFSTAMDFSLLSNATVQLDGAGADNILDTTDDVVIVPNTILSTNSQTVVVDLQGVPLEDGRYRLTIVGTGALVLTSLEGIELDGDNDGVAGGDFTSTFTVQGSAPQTEATWRWIQDNVFTPVCTQCHIAGGIASFLPLDENNSFAMLVNQTSSGDADLLLVAPADPDNSFLIQKVEGTASVGARMPLGQDPLAAQTIAAMRDWIAAGALLGPGDPRPDVTAPVVSVAAPSTVQSGNITINVAAVDDRAVTGVRLFVDDVLFGTDMTAPYEFVIDTTALTDADHTLRAEADDAAGNTGVSAIITFAVDNSPPPDTELPVVEVLAPASPASGTITVIVNASDNVAVTGVRLFVDGVVFGTDMTAPYEFVIDTTALTDADHTLRAEADDAAGNTGVSATLTFAVDNAPPPDTELPVVDVLAPASPASGTITVIVNASDNVAVTGVRLFVDGVVFGTDMTAPYEFVIDTTALTDADHTLRAEADDAAGNTGVSATLTFAVDNAPPPDTELPVVEVLAPASPASGTITVIVNASDNVAVTGVRLFVDGVVFGTDMTAPYEFVIDTTALTDADHTLRAEADDAAGNTGVSAIITFAVDNSPPPDTELPVVEVLAPASPASGTITVIVNASDNVAVTGVRLFVDGVVFGTDMTAPYEFVIDTTALTDADHTLRAEADDAAGNTGVSATLTFAVDNAPPPDTELPVVDVLAPASPASGTITVIVNASDNVAVTGVRLFVDGVVFGTDMTAPYEFVIDTTALTDADHTLRAEADDAAGNTGVSATLTFAVDNAPPPDTELPVVEVLAPASPASGTITVIVNASDNVAVTGVRLFVDGVVFGTDMTAPYEFVIDTTALTDADHTLRAEADDAAGNTGVSAIITFAVANGPPPDSIAPVVVIQTPVGDLNGTVDITVTASDDGGVTVVRLFLDGTLAGELTSAPYIFALNVAALSDGVHLLNASAEDSALNTGVADPLTVTVANGTPQATLPWIQDNIFSVSCATGCHSPGGIADFLVLTAGNSFSQLVNADTTEGGPDFRVLPGNPDESALVQRLEGTLTPSMPLFGAMLPPAQITAVRDWITSGANETPPDVIAPALSLSLPIAPAMGTVTLGATAVDDTGVTIVRFLVDGAEIGSDTLAPYETPFDTTLFPDGVHLIQAQAEDAAGNLGLSIALPLDVQNN